MRAKPKFQLIIKDFILEKTKRQQSVHAGGSSPVLTLSPDPLGLLKYQ